MFVYFLVPVLLAIFVVYILVAVKKPGDGVPAGERRKFVPPYIRRPAMTKTEVLFFQRLAQAVPEFVVAPQMAMSALVTLPAKQNQGKWAHVNRSAFAQKRLDYVLLNKQTGEVECVVELDDHTHDDRAYEDDDRDELLVGLGYEVLRFDAREMPSVAELRQGLMG